jgi:transketolase
LLHYDRRVIDKDLELKLERHSVNIRKSIIKMIFESQASHIGSSLSIVEMLTAAYASSDIYAIRNKEKFRNRIIVSKGHAACATYAAMHEFGLIDERILSTYHKNGSLLQGHVSHSVPGVEHSTGALGHGLSVGLGHAIFLKRFNSDAKVMVICGDGEIQEGSIWEAMMLAVSEKLNNLIILIDYNKISSIKNTEEIINTGPLRDRFLGFGAEVLEVDGHSAPQILDAINSNKIRLKPLVIICHTIKGKGLSFSENEAIWHYRTLNQDLFELAEKELK